MYEVLNALIIQCDLDCLDYRSERKDRYSKKQMPDITDLQNFSGLSIKFKNQLSNLSSMPDLLSYSLVCELLA